MTTYTRIIAGSTHGFGSIDSPRAQFVVWRNKPWCTRTVSLVNDSVGIRQTNLGRVLRLVHVDGPLSRAALTEATGLNRSTIADLIGALVEGGLVEERPPDPLGRVGRPSPVVAAIPEWSRSR